MKFNMLATVLCCAACAVADVGAGADVASTLPGDGRAELARELFEPLSFNLGDYFFVQEDLKKYISEMSVRNPVWDELKRYHHNHDYLGMLGVLSGEKLREYPSEETIRRLHAMLVESPILANIVHFQLSFSLTRKMSVVCRAFPGKDIGTSVPLGSDFQNILWKFRMKAGKCFYIYSPDNRINAIIKQYGDARDKVREDMKMARIFKDEGEKKIAELCERQYNDTLRWLATAKVVAGEPIAGRAPLLPSFWRAFNGEQTKGAKDGSGVSNGANYAGRSEAVGGLVVCGVCKGRKTVPEEEICSQCNGAGNIVRQSRVKDLHGNELPARRVKCTKCGGKGVIVVGRKPCEACDGKGRLQK